MAPNKTYHARPALVVAFNHEIGTLLVFECSAGIIGHSRRYCGNTIKGTMSRNTINHFFARCCSQGLFGCASHGFDRTVEEIGISCQECWVIGTVMMVLPGDVVELIDRVRPHKMLLAEVRMTISCPHLLADDIKRSMRFVTRVALGQ